MHRAAAIAFLVAVLWGTPAHAEAVCIDGTQSTADGSGACSHHGGVKQWLPDKDHPSTPPPSWVILPAIVAIGAASATGAAVGIHVERKRRRTLKVLREVDRHAA